MAENTTMLEIWSEAYSIFTDTERTEGQQYNDMQSYLMECVKGGKLTLSDKCCMAKDIMQTAAL